jgi:hypothetical protein
MTDHSKMRLGKFPRRHDLRTLKMARYLTDSLPAAPPAVDYTQGLTDWGMMLNDKLGCCTIAAVGHAIQTWTTTSSQSLTVPDSTILAYYEKWDGYNPADAGSDQGGVELDILNDWRQQGFSGQSLDAYVSIGLRDSGQVANGVIGRLGDRGSSEYPGSPDQPIPETATAIWLFGGAYIGVELPISAQNQDVWDVPADPGLDDEPGSWGGHAIYLVGYDRKLAIDDCRSSTGRQSTIGNGQSSIDNRQSTITCITWGQPKKMTWAWFEKYCSEAYALVSKDWLKASGVAPCGFDFATLENDLKLVTN